MIRRALGIAADVLGWACFVGITVFLLGWVYIR